MTVAIHVIISSVFLFFNMTLEGIQLYQVSGRSRATINQ